MKAKMIFVCLFLGIIYTACDDTVGRVGLSTRPEEDKISVSDETVFINARTIAIDSVYAKTPNGLLGEFYDPLYGSIKSSYICQYYPSVGFANLDSIVDNRIDSVRLNIYYSTYIGDSLAPMEVTVYPVIKALDKNYYTNANPDDYCDMNRPMAKYAYTARNMNISDSLLKLSNYYRYISIPMPVKLGQDYLNKVRNNELNTIDDFLDFFPGTYIKTTFGTGSVLPVDVTEIVMYYNRRATLKSADGGDSTGIVVSGASFTVTKEIVQLNKFENNNPAFLTQDDLTKTYIKSPAGVCTELTIPIREIVQGIGKKQFSSVSLSLQAYPQDDRPYPLQFPGTSSSLVPSLSNSSTGYSAKMLLIEPDSVINFFEMKKVADGKTSFTTIFNASTYTYDFNNISNVVQNAINKAPDKDLKLWLIPVLTTWVQQTGAYGSYGGNIDYMTSYYLYPSGVTLKKGDGNMKVRVIATSLNTNE